MRGSAHNKGIDIHIIGLKKRRYFRDDLAIGSEKYASLRSRDVIRMSRLMSGNIVILCSILKWIFFNYLFKFFRLIIACKPSQLLGLVKILDTN